METRIPRVILAGTNSGCGKTTVTCSILQAFVDRGLKVGAFKCGPDYIDTMFHSKIIGAKSGNLDLVFFSKNTARYLLSKNGGDRDINIIEGVMGFYDGISFTSPRASTYEVAQATQSPVILVVGAKGASLSVLATIYGFLELYPDNQIQGVILNQSTAMTYPALEKAIRDRFGDRIRPLGYLPPMPDCALESRHLGLITASEVENLKEKLQKMAQQAEKSIDLDGILALGREAETCFCDPVVLPHMNEKPKIAVAKDKAFCFYYEDSLEMLEEMGAQLMPFSPLTDDHLPSGVHGIYLGGGYPELYKQQLSENKSMLASICQALENHMPCIAECGGFMYLTKAIEGVPMAGYLPGTCFDNGKLTRFGYVTLEAKKDNLLCKAGGTIMGHEFHHWDCTEPGAGFTAKKHTGKTWDCVVATDSLYAGYPHFHFYSNPDFAVNFLQACIKFKGENCHD